MAEITSDLQSKINRAVRAVLIAEGAGTVTDTIAAPSEMDRTLPNTTVVSGDSQPFDGPGNWRFPVTLVLRDEAVTQPTEINLEASRQTANGRLSGILNALNRSDDEHTLYYTALELTTKGRALAVDASGGTDADSVQRAADNADMADFTVLWWESVSVGAAAKTTATGATFWERTLDFSCVACNNAIN